MACILVHACMYILCLSTEMDYQLRADEVLADTVLSVYIFTILDNDETSSCVINIKCK